MELKDGKILRIQVSSETFVEEPVAEIVARKKALEKKKDEIVAMIDELDEKIEAAVGLGYEGVT